MKPLITEEKEQNQCGSTNIFNSNIDFQCATTQNDYEEELNFLEAWLATPCLNELCIEVAMTPTLIMNKLMKFSSMS